jgi:hypothetical protein
MTGQRRRRLLLVGLGALALLGCGLIVWLTYPRHRLNQASYERIEVGMTLEEVEAILGGPAADYTGGRASIRFYAPRTLFYTPRTLIVRRHPVKYVKRQSSFPLGDN